ncbi:MAG TPA: glycoside hydrolase domain-containing protein [Opitutaceae bacterium]
MKALDSSSKTTGQAKKLADAGFEAVGIYLRSDRCTASMIAELHKANLKVWSIYEKGYPISDDYFSADQGAADGKAAATFAKTIEQPKGTQIYATVDYNPDEDDPKGPTIVGPISAYMKAFQAAIKPSGYITGVYGSGRTCRILLANGLVNTGWLTQSTSFAEYKAYKPKAGIIQLPRINNSWDGDTIPDPAVVGLW